MALKDITYRLQHPFWDPIENLSSHPFVFPLADVWPLRAHTDTRECVAQVGTGAEDYRVGSPVVVQ